MLWVNLFYLATLRQSWNLLLLAALARVIMPLANCIIIIIRESLSILSGHSNISTAQLYLTKNFSLKRMFLEIKEIYKLNYSLKKIKSNQPLSYVWSDNWYKIWGCLLSGFWKLSSWSSYFLTRKKQASRQ